MTKYLWTLGGGWTEASSLEDLREFYRRRGNMEFNALEVDDMGNRVDITNRIEEEENERSISVQKKPQKKWWQVWK